MNAFIILYPLACLIIPFVVGAAKKCFVPALWSAVINVLLFPWIYSSYNHRMDDSVTVGVVLMGIATLIMVILTITKSSPIRDGDAAAPQRTPAASPLKLSAGEQVILTRVCLPILPFALFIQSIVACIIGLGFALDDDEDVAVPLIVIGLAAMVIGYILLKLFVITLTVTNKRVIVRSAFNFRKSLPINRISAVGTMIFHTLYVGSSAGRILLPLVPELVEVYDTINDLQNERTE